MTQTVALVICPDGPIEETVGRHLAGLTVGERLLLALAASGVKRVGFVGGGERPRSDRAGIEIFEPTAIEAPGEGESFLLLPADAVFDRRLLTAADGIPDGLPLRSMPASAWKAIIADPRGFTSLLGAGEGASGKGFALRVTDRAFARVAERCLLRSLKKDTDGLVSRTINRRISLACTRYLVRTGLRPNHLTVVIMLIGVASGIFAALAEPWWWLVLGGALFQAQSVLDGCDGEIARLTYRFSKLGQWLDSVGDDLTNYSFFLGLAVGQARTHDAPWLYAFGGGVFALQWAASGINYQRLIKLGTGDLLAIPNMVTGGTPGGVLGRVVRSLHVIAKRDTFVLLVAVLAAAQLPLVALFGYAAGSVGMFVGVLMNELRIRDAGRAGAGAQPPPA
jgi:phosphatidylglycerophosphate synthase